MDGGAYADRLSFYGKDRPIHVSHSKTPVRQLVNMAVGRRERACRGSTARRWFTGQHY